jgi:hypothetical protein
MENDFNLELSEIRRQKILNYNNKINTGQNKFELEENKINKKSRKFLFDKEDFHKEFNNLLLKSKKNVQIRPILQNYPKFNDNNFLTNKSTFRDNQKSVDEISKDKSDKKIHNFSRNLSVLNKINKAEKCFDFNKYLIKNKSTSFILNKSNQILPLIKPRKILINICSGPFEFKITDINKRNYSFKKFGKNSFFMGERYNPDNYAIKEKIKVGRNYYGALYSN